MNVDEMIQGAQNALAVSRVYGEPIQQNGVTLIPTAEVLGGGGGGSDEANNGGGGFGVRARPVGVWVIRGEQVEWEPAMDATKMALRGMLVAIVFLFVVRSVVKTVAGR
ncbi:MAG: sporulation protein [Chloroflexi bacterium]|nr:MAG: sporulation protein [Chloroflexota bacterium]